MIRNNQLGFVKHDDKKNLLSIEPEISLQSDGRKLHAQLRDQRQKIVCYNSVAREYYCILLLILKSYYGDYNGGDDDDGDGDDDDSDNDGGGGGDDSDGDDDDDDDNNDNDDDDDDDNDDNNNNDDDYDDNDDDNMTFYSSLSIIGECYVSPTQSQVQEKSSHTLATVADNISSLVHSSESWKKSMFSLTLHYQKMKPPKQAVEKTLPVYFTHKQYHKTSQLTFIRQFQKAIQQQEITSSTS